MSKTQDEPRLDEPTVNLTMEALKSRVERIQALPQQVPLPRPDAFMEQNIPEEHLKALVVFVQATDADVLSLALKLLGDAARTVSNRNVISALNPFSSLNSHLDSSASSKNRFSDEVIRNALRLLANLCFDNAYARDKVLAEPHLLQRIVSQLERANKEGLIELQRVCAGAIANISSTHEENRLFLVQNKIVEFSLKLIRDIDNDDNMVGELVGLLQALSATKTVMNDLVMKNDLIGALLKALANVEEVPIVADVAEFLQSIAENEAFRDEFLHQGHLDSIRSSFLNTEIDSAVRLSAGRLYAALSSSDAIMPRMYAEMELFVNLLRSDPSKEVQQIAAITLGNLARTDEKVGEMMDRGVAAALVDVLKDTSRDLSVRHYSLSCLRNIALLERNKMFLFKMEILPAAIKLLSERMSPVLVHSDLGLLKNLLLGGEAIVKSALECGLLEALKPLIDFEDADHVKFESCRLVGQLCKDSFTHDRIVSEGLVTALKTLVNAKWDVLVLEGSLAIKLISDNSASNREKVGLLSGVLASLRGVISRKSETKAEILEETKVVALKALESLSQSDKVARRLFNLKLHEGLDLKSKDDLVAKILERVEKVKGQPMPDIDSMPSDESDNSKKGATESTEESEAEYTPKVEPLDDRAEK